jgi:hypothetical protein
MVGSVSIIGLFVAGTAMHADAINRRTASFIADELLAEVRGMRFREAYAQTQLSASIDATDTYVGAFRTSATGTDEAASFNLYPLPDVGLTRGDGAIMIGSELIWCGALDTVGPAYGFGGCVRGTNSGGTGENHFVPARILQPRSWYYMVADQGAVDYLPGPDDANYDTADSLLVHGTPNTNPPYSTNPGAPATGYIVVDQEWIQYTSRDADSFDWGENVDDFRGAGATEPARHQPGAPVAFAREHLRYPGFYYAVQFYPVNATGAEAKVLVSVGYGNEARFRVHFFHTVFTPTRY